MISPRHPSEAIGGDGKGPEKWSLTLLKELRLFSVTKNNHVAITPIHIYFNDNCMANLTHASEESTWAVTKRETFSLK